MTSERKITEGDVINLQMVAPMVQVCPPFAYSYIFRLSSQVDTGVLGAELLLSPPTLLPTTQNAITYIRWLIKSIKTH